MAYFHDSESDSNSMEDEDTLHKVQGELEEWVSVNRELRQYGLPAVKILQPSKLHTMPDAVGLSPDAAQSLREILRTLMRDCDRRQQLVQELIVTNNQLKDDLRQQSAMTEKYGSKVKDLKAMLDTSREHVQDLESEKLDISTLQQEEEEKLRNTKNAVQLKNRQLKHRCKTQEEEIERLRKKLSRMNEEDEQRVTRQNQVFQEFKRRAARANNEVDDKLLDVIDSYERQIRNLKKELELQSPDESVTLRHGHVRNTEMSLHTDDVTPNFKALIKTYEKKIRDSEKNIKRLENNNDLLRLEMESRPELSDYRTAQNRIKKLEKNLRKHQISLPGEVLHMSRDDCKKYSTNIEDLDYLPLPHCQRRLKLICEEAGVKDVDHVIKTLQDQRKIAEIQPQLEQFIRDVVDIVERVDCLAVGENVNLSQARSTQPLSEKSLQNTLSKVQCWQQQLCKLQELQQSVNRLFSCLGIEKSLSGQTTMTQIIEVIDEVANNDGIIVADKNSEKPSPVVLQGIVEHFQKLFDVTKLSGVYPRMNDVYTKLGEVHNVLNTLKQLLGLDPKSKSSAIVDAVGRLCNTHHMTTTTQLKQLLEVEELGSVIKKLQLYEEFVPTFQEVVSKLMKILDVERMDQVIPSVRALKLLAG